MNVSTGSLVKHLRKVCTASESRSIDGQDQLVEQQILFNCEVASRWMVRILPLCPVVISDADIVLSGLLRGS